MTVDGGTVWVFFFFSFFSCFSWGFEQFQTAVESLHIFLLYLLWIAQEIFSSLSHKTQHFQIIHRTGVPFNSMLFFNDEDRNIESVKMASNISSSLFADIWMTWIVCSYIGAYWNCYWYWQVSKMGVTSILVGNGLNIGALSQGLTKFSQNSASSGNTKRNWMLFWKRLFSDVILICGCLWHIPIIWS